MFISDALSVNQKGNLCLGGADVTELAAQYGTPVYLMDEDLIRATCREYKNALEKHYGGGKIAYASKAFNCARIYTIMREEGLGADVASGGELYTALRAGMPAKDIYFHGNNKTLPEIEYALAENVGRFVVDNAEELALLNQTAIRMGKRQDIQLRIKPGVEAHTHEFVRVGRIDSKFGVALETGEAMDLVEKSLKLPGVRLIGIHCHIGSQIFGSEPFREAALVMGHFAADIRDKLSYGLEEINLGGGFGIKYLPAHTPRTPDENISAAAAAIKEVTAERNNKPPRLVFEPGRAIVGPAGVTVYTVGSVKEIPGVRNYVAVDGGMADNPRPGLYDAEYSSLIADRPLDKAEFLYTISGRCCESDTLIKKTRLPKIKPGDLLCVLATGAYNYSMASNYNRLPRPPVVMIRGGQPYLAAKRETYEDIIKNDVF